MSKSPREIIDELLEYAVRFAEQNEEPDDGGCWESIETARAYMAQPISKPSNNLGLKLLQDADSYLREIRAENLDGSEPALGELLENVTDFWVALDQTANTADNILARRTEALEALKADGLTILRVIQTEANNG